MQCRQLPTCPWDHFQCFCSPVPPCTAGGSLLGRCLCGSFCFSVTCVGFPQPPKRILCVAGLCTLDSQFLRPTLCVARLVYPCFSSRCGLCVAGLVWTCLGCLCSPSALGGLCAVVSIHCLHSFSQGLFVLSAVPGGLCVLPKSVCLPSIGTPVPPFVPAVCLASDTRLPGLALCAARVVRTGWVCLHWLRLSAVSNSAGFICHATWRPGVFCCRLEVAL